MILIRNKDIKLAGKFFLSLLPAVFLFPLCLQAAENDSPQLPAGERLIYKITWLKIPVGYGEISVGEKTMFNGRAVYPVSGKIETNSVLSKIFPTHDWARSWIDAETLESLRFEKKIDELFINTHERMTFDAAANKGYFESFKKGGRKNEFPVTAPAHDVLSVFYWVRRQSFGGSGPVQTTLYADQKKWRLTVDVLEKQILKHNGEKIETLRVEPHTVVDGKEIRNQAWLNITDDARHLPIRLVYKAIFGSVVGTLVDSAQES